MMDAPFNASNSAKAAAKSKDRKVIIVPFESVYGGGGKKYVMDECDHFATCNIAMRIEPEVDDVETRAFNLWQNHQIAMGNNLNKLNLSCSSIASLPSDIGQLQNLQDLDLGHTKELSQLPEEIGNLVNLNKLTLSYSSITSLPSSIGQLQNLQDLNLHCTKELSQLPEEIGNLVNLNKLNLPRSSITSLPSSIGQLQNLQDLDLHCTKELSQLPEEIGNLVNLNKLNLSYSSITSLPSSIGQLQNLQDLDLGHTKELSQLPEEIGNLVNLNKLNLSYSSITSLPSSMGQLQKLDHLSLSNGKFHDPMKRLSNLKYLVVKGTNIAELRADSGELLLKLAQRCQSLGYLCARVKPGCEEKKLYHTLACNRARSRTMCGKEWGSVLEMPKLMPLVIDNGGQAFSQFPICHLYGYGWPQQYEIEKPHAIYRLLGDGRGFFRESLIRILLGRNTGETRRVVQVPGKHAALVEPSVARPAKKQATDKTSGQGIGPSIYG